MAHEPGTHYGHEGPSLGDAFPSVADGDGQDAAEIPQADERARKARELVQKVLDAARELLAHGMIQATGYRVLVKPLEATKGLELAEAVDAPTLAERGFETKTESQRVREERGTNHAILMHIGPVAFKNIGGREAWPSEGELVICSRYAGTRVEHPKGSDVWYQLMNDEDLYGKVI